MRDAGRACGPMRTGFMNMAVFKIAAVVLLLEQIRRRRAGGEAEVTQKLLDYALMIRESSGPPA